MKHYLDKQWTFGAEHELGDWDRSKDLPKGFGIDKKDKTVMNSNGIAADPKGKLYGFGGEINTPPTDTPEEQVGCLVILKRLFSLDCNHRSNLHIHVRVPGLKDDLETLKKLARYVRNTSPQILHLVEPIPEPTKEEYPDPQDYKDARRRYNRRKVSHHTVIPENRVAAQEQATTIQEFFEAEVPRSKDGKPMWHFQPRAAINLRQLLETDTIEFRHWPGTLNSAELMTAVKWCEAYLQFFFNGWDPVELYACMMHLKFPEFPKFEPWKERRYRATCHDGTLTKEEIANNIRRIENGEFDENPSALSCKPVQESTYG